MDGSGCADTIVGLLIGHLVHVLLEVPPVDERPLSEGWNVPLESQRTAVQTHTQDEQSQTCMEQIQ